MAKSMRPSHVVSRPRRRGRVNSGDRAERPRWLVGAAGLEPTSVDYRSTALTFVLLAVYVGLKPFSCPNSPYRQSYILPSDRSRRFFDKATISSKVGKLISEIAPSN